jgi:hypothetical protein
VKYDDVKIADMAGKLMLQKGEAKEENGKLEVKGKLERGMSFRSGAKYKAEGAPNLKVLIIYIDEVGGLFRFKID